MGAFIIRVLGLYFDVLTRVVDFGLVDEALEAGDVFLVVLDGEADAQIDDRRLCG